MLKKKLNEISAVEANSWKLPRYPCPTSGVSSVWEVLWEGESLQQQAILMLHLATLHMPDSKWQ